jgi:hypothetical protein
VRAPKNGYVSSVISGVINEYDANGGFVRTICSPAGETLGETTFSTGTPLGLGVGPDTLYRRHRDHDHERGHRSRPGGNGTPDPLRQRRTAAAGDDGRQPRVPGRHRRVRAEEAVTN